jgi:hypothetical protein
MKYNTESWWRPSSVHQLYKLVYINGSDIIVAEDVY